MTSDYLDRPTRSLEQLAAELRERLKRQDANGPVMGALGTDAALRRVEAEIAARKAP